MPKRKNAETPDQQVERFKMAVQAMVDTGELNPTEADDSFNRAMEGLATLRQAWFQPEEGPESRFSEPD